MQTYYKGLLNICRIVWYDCRIFTHVKQIAGMGKSVNAHNGFRLDHVILSPRQQIGTHQQDTWELTWVLRGML